MSNVVSIFSKQNEPKGFESVDIQVVRHEIIRPALQITSLWSQAAENLLVATGSVESNFDQITQIGGGPALSWFQIEPFTYNDLCKYLNNRRPEMRNSILTACYLETFPDAAALKWHVRLAVLMARAQYFRRPEPLPNEKDAQGLCNYYLKFYNTHEGASEFSRAIKHFEEAIL